MTETAYDRVAYDDRPVAETHPARLFDVARSWGVDAVPPERARILELGCANGANLLPLAYRYPGAELLGVDLSVTQIEAARRASAELDLANVEWMARDASALDLGERPFDYVIAHGLFSWVPASVQTGILTSIRSSLAAGGVAYVSYNAMPGWGVRGSLRAALLAMAAGSGDEGQQIARARAALSVLREIRPHEGTAEGAMLELEIDELDRKPDMYLLHEYLVPEQSAFTVGQFVELAQRHGLAYLDDVAPLGLEAGRERPTRAAIDALDLPRIAAEHVLDLVCHRQFRATLLVRDCEARFDERREPDEARSPSRPPAEIPVRPRVGSLTRFEIRRGRYASTPEHAVAEVDPFHAALVEHLDGTRTIDELAEAMLDDVAAGRLSVAGGATPPSPEQLRAAMPDLVRAGVQRLAAGGFLEP